MYLSSRKSLSIAIFTALVACLIFSLAGTHSAAATSSELFPQEQRSAELDAKISELGIHWRQLRRQLRSTGEQAKLNLTADADEAKLKLADLLAERRGIYRSQIEDLKQEVGTAWQQLQAAGADSEEEITKRLEGLRSQWKIKYAQLRDSHDQHVKQLQEKVAELESEAKLTAEDWNENVQAERAQLRKEYQREADKLRATYREFITTAQQELGRLRSEATNAKTDAKLCLAEAADLLSQELHMEYDKLRGHYQEIIAKAHDYFEDSEQQLKTAKADVATKIEAERLATAKWVSGIYEEMAASYETYQSELNKQVASLESRMSQADADTRAKLQAAQSKLQAKQAIVEKELNDDYQAAVVALQDEITRLDGKSKQLTNTGRAKTVEAIEFLQAKLETAKKKLQRR